MVLKLVIRGRSPRGSHPGRHQQHRRKGKDETRDLPAMTWA